MRREVRVVAGPSARTKERIRPSATSSCRLRYTVPSETRGRRGARARRPIPPSDATRCRDRLEHEAPLAGRARGRGAGRVDISVTIPITDEDPVSTREDGRRARRSFELPLQSERLGTAAPSPTSAGRDFPLGVPGLHLPGPPPRGPPRRPRPGVPGGARAGRTPALADAAARPTAPIRRPLDPLARSRLLVDAARPLGRFVARLFGVEREWRRQIAIGRPGGGPLPVPARLRAAPGRPGEAAREPRRPCDRRGLAGGGRRASSAAPPRPPLGRRPGARDRADGRRGCSTSRRTSSRRSGRRRSPRSRRGARERRDLALAPPRVRAGAALCPAPRAPGTRPSSPSSRRCSRPTPSGPTCAASTRTCGPRSAAGPPSTARDARLPRLVETERPNPALPEERVGPGVPPAPPRRLRLTDPRMTRARGARRDALLPALPRAGEGLLLEGVLRREDGHVPEEPARRRAARAARSTRRSRRCTSCGARATRSARSRSSASTTRCARAPATGSATTA